MKRSRLTDEQMVRILREADASPVSEVAKRHGVSEQTIYAWRKRYGELEVAEARRLRALEQESARLKQMLAERDLEIDVMKEISKNQMVSVAARRQQVAYANGRGVSKRRACRPLSVARSALHYQSRLVAKDAPLLEVMHELARQYPR
jgi:putative transposase